MMGGQGGGGAIIGALTTLIAMKKKINLNLSEKANE